MNQLINYLFLLPLIFISTGCRGQESIESYLQQQFENVQLNGNVLVMQNGKTIYEKSFGFTDGSKTTLLTNEHRFNIGSIYKEFPAVAIMQLAEKNSLDVNDKISKYLPELPVWSHRISIKNLLQYSSGLPKIGWSEYFSNGIEPNEDNIFREIASVEKLQFEPGSDYLYTNMSPILLIKTVEKVSQMSFKEYLRKNIFTPFDLQTTVLKDRYPYTDTALMAIPFNSEFKEDDYKISVQSLLFSSTTIDLHKWFTQLDNFEVVTKESVLFLSETAKAGENIQSPLGNCKWENGNITEHSHHGSTANYECLARHYKEEDITIIILTNQKNGNLYDLSDTIFELVKTKTE